MGGSTPQDKKSSTMQNSTTPPPVLHTRLASRRTWPNRIFSLIYSSTILALLLHNFHLLLHSNTTKISLLMILSDFVLAFMWIIYQGFRMSPIRRETFPEKLQAMIRDEREYPAMDVFICTADPYKEPPMVAVNTALSIMAYDYPTDKLSVYVSDDGGSQLTLFAFIEAAKFAKYWLPFCKKNNIMDRCPEAYFSSNNTYLPDEIKAMYESMKIKVENSVSRGKVCDGYISEDEWLHAFSKWTDEFTRQDHPAVIQVLLDSTINKDCVDHTMPNLTYVSREKSNVTPHNNKAGALNALLRVSETMTNAPIILTVDCDMYSNDPKTPLRALCYFLDSSLDSKFAFVQFPQLFYGINKDDIYGAAFKFIFEIETAGMDGLLGPIYCGSGTFFRRQALFGGPSLTFTRESTELSPPHKSIQSNDVIRHAHEVAGCKYEARTKWGLEVGFRYGSLVEDFYTGYHLHCQGWRSIFCHPKRPAFLGNAPMSLDDLLNQTKRWSMGVLDVTFCKYNPINYGIKLLPTFQTLCYLHYIFWPIWCIPIIGYAFLPQLALINSFQIFPKVSDPWFLLYPFLFLGAYGQDFLDFVLGGGTIQGWCNNQRMWLVRGLSSYPFGLVEYFLKSFGISSSTFNLTSKVVDNELSKRYDKGLMEFGVESSFFIGITMAAMINLLSFIRGVVQVLKYGGLENLLLQILLAGFGVINSWPIYEAMVLRSDKGRMPLKITLIAIALVLVLYLASPLAF